MRPIYFIIRFIVGTLSAVILFACYYVCSQFALQFIGLDVWFTRMLAGMLGVTACLWLFSWLNHFLLFYTKHALIYAVAVDRTIGPIKAIGGLLRRGKTITSVVVLNYFVRKGLHDVAVCTREKYGNSGVASDDTTTGKVQSIPEECYALLEGLGSTFVIHKSLPYVTKAFDYIDECVLLYCYRHEDLNLGEASFQAISLFLKHAVPIMKKVYVVAFMHSAIRWLLSIVFCVCYYKSQYFGFHYLFMAFMIHYCIIFIIETSFLEPLFMISMLETFMSGVLDSEELGAGTPIGDSEIDVETIIKMSPWFKKIKTRFH